MNKLQIIMLNKLTNLENMFNEPWLLKNIEELKYLNIKEEKKKIIFHVCSMDVHLYQI